GNKPEQIDKLTAALEEKQEALLENVKMLDSLSKTIESKVQMLQEHVAIIGEKDTQLAALSEEVARLNKLASKK
ncbi:MAG: hypothetical protein IAF58_18000, partial [Leptolyngbya sp.]|nr:hypothetical protein [Candidatus Melainabacteria bacterium]